VESFFDWNLFESFWNGLKKKGMIPMIAKRMMKNIKVVI
jgi:hypothetical protein